MGPHIVTASLLTVLWATVACPPAVFLDRMGKWIEKGDLEAAIEKGEEKLARCSEGDDTTSLETLLQTAWLQRAREQRTIEAMAAVRERFPGTATAQEALGVEMDLDWSDTVQRNTVETYADHQKRYPGSPHAADAARYERQLALDRVAASPSIEAWEQFRQRFPERPASPETVNREGEIAFMVTERRGSATAWMAYLEEYGQHSRAAEAKERQEKAAFEESLAVPGTEALVAYLASHEGGAHNPHARWALVTRLGTLTIEMGGEVVEVPQRGAGDDQPTLMLPVLGAGTRFQMAWDQEREGDPEALPAMDLSVLLDDGQLVPVEEYVRALAEVMGSDEEIQPFLDGAIRRTDAPAALELEVRLPLARLPATAALPATAGYALTIPLPPEVSVEPARLLLEVQRRVSPPSFGSTILYHQDGALYQIDASRQEARKIAAFPVGTTGWTLLDDGTALTWGTSGAARVDLASSRVVQQLIRDSPVKEVVRFDTGLAIVLVREDEDAGAGRPAQDHALLFLHDGTEKSQEIIPFGSSWNGVFLTRNGEWFVYSLRDARSNSWRKYARNLVSGGVRTLPKEIRDKLALSPEGSTLVYLPYDAVDHLWTFDLGNGKRRQICRVTEFDFDGCEMMVSWPGSAPGPVVSYQWNCGERMTHILVPVTSGRFGSPGRIPEADLEAWMSGAQPLPRALSRAYRGGGIAVPGQEDTVPGRAEGDDHLALLLEELSADLEELLRLRGEQKAGGFTLFEKRVGRTPEVFARNLATAEEVRISRTDHVPAERRCGDPGLSEINGITFEVLPGGDHVAFLAYRFGCDAGAGPLFIARVDGQGEQVELGPDSGIPGWVHTRWSPDGRFLLISGIDARPTDLAVYSSEGRKVVLDSHVTDARWFSPSLRLVLAGSSD